MLASVSKVTIKFQAKIGLSGSYRTHLINLFFFFFFGLEMESNRISFFFSSAKPHSGLFNMSSTLVTALAENPGHANFLFFFSHDFAIVAPFG